MSGSDPEKWAQNTLLDAVFQRKNEGADGFRQFKPSSVETAFGIGNPAAIPTTDAIENSTTPSATRLKPIASNIPREELSVRGWSFGTFNPAVAFEEPALKVMGSGRLRECLAATLQIFRRKL